MENIRIVIDSSGDVLKFEEIGFASAPLKIITAEKEYVDNEELNVEEMVEALLQYSGKSSTSCPNPEDWLKTFGDAQTVYCVTITAALSGSYNSACIAKNVYMQEHPDRKVYVINSYSTGPEMKLIIEKIRELVLSGIDSDEVEAQTKEYMKNTGLLFVLQSMRNLANNGRVSHLKAKMAGILGIRALGRASDEGTLEMLEKCRGENNAVIEMISQLKKHGFNGGKIRIAHCLNEGFALRIKELILKEFSNADVEVYSCRGLCSFYAEKGGLLVGFEK
ncbi:MAG: DegV family EDD domain-containing protein [Clostridia bacterium]|nr:DegV family EDD domain-containing protein [Clostridia bacterium]